jgi:hypothetical protein
LLDTGISEHDPAKTFATLPETNPNLFQSVGLSRYDASYQTWA